MILCFVKMRTKIIFLFLFIVHFSAVAQKQLKGTIFSKEKNTPLSFVNISILDKNTATISDENGNFEIQVKPTDTLIFSMVGYQTLRIAATQCKEKIFLEP